MPVVNFLVCLDLEQNISFLNGHKIVNSVHLLFFKTYGDDPPLPTSRKKDQVRELH